MNLGLVLNLRRRRGFSIQNLFSGGRGGTWLSYEPISGLSQDSGGTTPVTASGDRVGRVADRSGNGLVATQATADSRLTYQATGLVADGVDDHVEVVSATGLTSDMYLAVSLKSAAANFVMMATDQNGWVFPAQSASSSTALFEGVGTPTFKINGTVFSGNRGDLFTAVCDDTWKVIEITDLDLSGGVWTDFLVLNYIVAGFEFQGTWQDFILCETPTEGRQTQTRNWLNNRVNAF